MKKFLSLTLFIALLATACKKNTKDAAHAESENNKAAMSVDGETFNVDPVQSSIHWTGSKPGKDHTGIVPVKSGSVKVKNGDLVSGSFVIDFANLQNTDLKPEEGKGSLEAHLKGLEAGKEDDFFNVTKFPTGKFEITKVAKLESSEAANVLVYGNLSIKDKTNPISFKAQFSKTPNGYKAKSDAFKIDRTKWGINFMSNSVFDNLKDKFINDQIELSIDISAKK